MNENILDFLKADGVLKNQPYMCVYHDRQCPFAEEIKRHGQTFAESGNQDPSEWTYYCHLLHKEVWAEQAECTLLQILSNQGNK